MPLSRPAGKILNILLIIMGLALNATAQGTTDEQLAAHYYREGEYDKALLYYERLYSRQPSEENYGYFLNCLLALERYKDAERLAERQAKAHPSVLHYQVDVGRVLLRAGEDDRADKVFDRVIRNMNEASVNQVLDVGRAFSEMNEDDRALEVYYLGRKLMGNAYPFHFQIAQVLGQKGDIEGMINEYLDVLTVSEGYLQSVQTTLNRVVGFEEEGKYNIILQEQLLKRIQKNPDSEVYAEMLIWMYMQQNKFEAALIQVKALDKRNREDGARVINLAQLALSNYKYNVAIDGFEYVKSKGPGNYYYLDAMTGLLRSLKAKVINTDYSQEAIDKLILEYDNALSELGKQSSTASIIRDYAHIKAFYQSRYDNTAVAGAIEMLQHALGLPGLSSIATAEVKLELADIYVLSNNIWEASLLYGQVEKAFKHDEIGHQAKLKNAKVFYYAGDFGWAETQLDVLKGSTSKLISNDALELSAFISENTGLDTTTEALSMFAKTELLAAQHKYDSALIWLSAIEEKFPYHDLADNILFERAGIYAETGRYEDAVKTYLQIPETYPYGILADNALIEAGRLYETVLNDKESAMGAYQRILTDYSGSLFVVEARKRFRSLRGDQYQ